LAFPTFRGELFTRLVAIRCPLVAGPVMGAQRREFNGVEQLLDVVSNRRLPALTALIVTSV
jgi:hypothetical protein